jgi:hypothetical protein
LLCELRAPPKTEYEALGMRSLSSLLLLAIPLLACAAEPSRDEAVATDTDELGTSASASASASACTSTLGSGLVGGSHGRLDGDLVAIVPAGSHQCHGDRDHTHLQIRMSGQVYDVAINIDGVKVAETDAPLVDGTFSEGWHTDAPLDYARDLGMHSSSFQRISAAALQQHLASALANADHISVYATKYSRGGIHLVHRSRSSQPLDGAIVISPTTGTGTPHYFLFQFPDQCF